MPAGHSPVCLRFLASPLPWLPLLLLASIPFPPSGAIQELDNALIGQPNISCHPDTIEMRFRTKRAFTGKIYVQGHFSNPDCRVDFGQQGAMADHDGKGGIRLHHGSCNMDRQRMANEGMQFSTVLVISFHPLFITKTDRAFHINCLYRENSTPVQADMNVGDVTPAPILNDMPIPHCHYTIRKDQLDGEILKFARVGDLIVHRWECDSDMYGMLVHSCYVEDGQGERVEVIDQRGCHMDSQVLGDPTYTEALNMAYRESLVFKFRDRLGVRFSCEIKLCVKEGDGCADITPPDCSDTRFQHSRDDVPSGGGLSPSMGAALNSSHSLTVTAGRKRMKRSSSAPLPGTHQLASGGLAGRTVDADLISQYVFVLDEPVEEEEGGEGRLLAAAAHSPSICLSSALLAAIGVLVLLVFGLASAVVGHSICHHYKSKRRNSSSSAASPFSCASPSFGVRSTKNMSPIALFLKR